MVGAISGDGSRAAEKATKMARAEAIVTGERELDDLMAALGRGARRAARAVALAPAETKNAALRAAAAELRRRASALLAANALDVAEARGRGTAASFLDRLTLDASRVEAMALGLEEIAELADPVGRLLASFERPNGLLIERVATPLGVIGVIYESRPNVTADAGGLCLKAGNAAILRGGSESLRSSRAIHACLVAGLVAAGLPEAAISLRAVADRAAVGAMLAGLDGTSRRHRAARRKKPRRAGAARGARAGLRPSRGHRACLRRRAADLDMAKRIVLNAKLRRTGICGAAETLLVDRAGAPTHSRAAGEDAARRRLRSARRRRGAGGRRARETGDRGRLARRISRRHHRRPRRRRARGGDRAYRDTTARITPIASSREDEDAARRFMAEVDSAIVLHNASTQFADGGEFGFGAEIGIATGRMHARGPVGVEQLTTFKYRVHGDGQVRG